MWTNQAPQTDSPMVSQNTGPAPPQLFTLENCTSSSRIRAFLRLSRIATDDTIRQHLNEIKPGSCNSYFRTKIAPQWKARQELIQYCESRGAELRHETDQQGSSAQKPDFDLTLDPYALKEYQRKLESQYSVCQTIENWVENEKGVESIIREQTSNVLNDKCYFNDWMAEFKRLNSQWK